MLHEDLPMLAYDLTRDLYARECTLRGRMWGPKGHTLSMSISFQCQMNQPV